MGLCWDLRGSAWLQFWRMTILMVLLVSSTLSKGSGAPWSVGGGGDFGACDLPSPF